MDKISSSDMNKFSADGGSFLIKCVSEFEVLSKLSHPDFKNVIKKDKISNQTKTIFIVVGHKLHLRQGQ